MSSPRWLCVLGALLVLTAGSSVGQEPIGQETSEALLLDATWYAEQNGVDLKEAVRRLQLQQEISALDAALSEEERGNFAGLWIEHEPEYRVVVRFKEAFTEEHLRQRIAATPLARLIEVRPAKWSLEELRGRQAACRHMASELGVAVNSDINVFENRVEVYAVEPQTLETRLAATGLELPEGVTIVPVEHLVEPNQQTLHGGVPLTTCSGGFTVRRSNGDLGISTSGHCGNNQIFAGTALPFRNERDSGNQDLQWHSACDLFDVTNEFETGIGLRRVTGTQHRNNQAIGSFVCSWGMTSGRKCGDIQSRSFDPGSGYSGTFVRVDGDRYGIDMSRPGDCGGPWFVEHLAYGINNGSVGALDAYYTPINYMSNIGVSVLTFDPGPGCNLLPSANFTWKNPFGFRVDFDASSSSDPDGNIVSYRWDFDDGRTATTSNPKITHFYNAAQNYIVTLTVTDNEGGTASRINLVNLCGPEFICTF